MTEQILPILGVRSVDQIFAEVAQKIRDPKNKSVLDMLPHSLRVLVRLRELRQWNVTLANVLLPPPLSPPPPYFIYFYKDT
jgi:hypothetical protein